MQKKKAAVLSVVSVVAVAAIAMIIVFSLNGHAVQNPGSQNGANSETLFSSSQFYQYAYQIFPGVLSPSAREAITGFNLDLKNNPDGSTTINLVATNPEYKNQTYTVQQGQKLYFIERSLRDDSGGEEKFLGDDMAVVVNSAGYIVQGPNSA